MVAFLELLARLVDLFALLGDLILNWRLALSILVALGLVLVLREVGVGVDGGSFAIAAFIGLVVGLVWELFSAPARPGHV